MTIFEALTRQADRLGHQPAVVFADAATGERTELSFLTLHNWVSKAANLLVDPLDVGMGEEVSVVTPLHWLAPVAVLATWAVGAAVRLGPGGTAQVAHEADGPADAAADLLLGTGMAGRPTGAVPAGALTVVDVLAQPDDFVDDPGDEGAWAIGARTQAALLAAAGGRAGRVLHAGDRVDEAAVDAIAATIPAGRLLVLARGFDPEGLRRLADQEGVDATG